MRGLITPVLFFLLVMFTGPLMKGDVNMKALFVLGLVWFGIAVLWYGIRRNEKETQKGMNVILEQHLMMQQNKKLLEKMYADLQESL